MGKNKKIVIFLVIIGIVLLISGGTYAVVTKMNKEKKQIEDAQNKVISKYQEFKKEADKFVDARKKYHTVVVEDLFVESVEEDYEKWMKSFEEYQKIVDAVIEKEKDLNKLCIDKTYPDKNVMTNCQSFMINYETVMNYFVKDVEEFNKFMDEYYKDYKGNKTLYPKYQLNEDVYHYVDMNDDGEYIGKDK